MAEPEAHSQTSVAYAVPIAGADGKLAVAFVPSHASTHQDGGSDEMSVAGLSGLLADGQTPLAHAASHNPGGSDALTGYEVTSAKNAASGYAGLSSASRITKGVITTDDVIVDLATKGLVLKDAAGTPHYWRVTISTLGVLTTTDLGTSPP